ncbi:conserved hypothetical protein, partial [Ricinus communis]
EFSLHRWPYPSQMMTYPMISSLHSTYSLEGLGCMRPDPPHTINVESFRSEVLKLKPIIRNLARKSYSAVALPDLRKTELPNRPTRLSVVRLQRKNLFCYLTEKSLKGALGRRGILLLRLGTLDRQTGKYSCTLTE